MNLTLRAEWTKIRTSAGTFWLLLTAICLTIGLGSIVDASVHCASAACNQDPAKVSLAGVYVGQVLVAISAVTIIGAEYATGRSARRSRRCQTALRCSQQRRSSPRVVLGAGTTAGIVGSAVVGHFVLHDKGFTPTNGYASLALTDAAMLRAAFGSVLYLVLIAGPVGISTAVRDCAGIGRPRTVVAFPTLLVMVTNPTWHRHLEQLAPMNAGLGIQTTVDLHSLALSPWAGLGVLGLWAVGALTLGSVLHVRDA